MLRESGELRDEIANFIAQRFLKVFSDLILHFDDSGLDSIVIFMLLELFLDVNDGVKDLLVFLLKCFLFFCHNWNIAVIEELNNI